MQIHCFAPAKICPCVVEIELNCVTASQGRSMAALGEDVPESDSESRDGDEASASASDVEADVLSNRSDAGTDTVGPLELEDEAPSTSGRLEQTLQDTGLSILPPEHPALQRAQQALRKQLQETLIDFRGKLKEKQVALKVSSAAISWTTRLCGKHWAASLPSESVGREEEKGGCWCGPLWAAGAACKGAEHN